MIGKRVRGKKPIAVLVIMLVWWVCRDATADNVYQQIDYALNFIGGAIFLAILVWFVDSQRKSTESLVKDDQDVPPLVAENGRTKSENDWITK